jgi:hypothetical protein
MPTTFATTVRFCTTCRADVGFEQPECLDGHGGDCPELVCVACGEAFLVGFGPPEAPARRFRSVA